MTNERGLYMDRFAPATIAPIPEHYEMDILPLNAYADALAEHQAARATIEQKMDAIGVPLIQANETRGEGKLERAKQ